jgi:hypothetical protein
MASVLRPVLKALEGQPRPGPYRLPITGGFLPAGAPINWWQHGMSPLAGDRSAVVERCISLYAQSIASLPGSHWRANGRGGRTRVTNSALARILKRPNDYQSISDFMLNAVRSLYFEGNAYALALIFPRTHRGVHRAVKLGVGGATVFIVDAERRIQP